MKKNENLVQVTLTLPKNFDKKIIAEIQKELIVAIKKWNVILTDKEKKSIVETSILQLEGKVSSIAHSVWSIKDTELVILISSKSNGRVEISLPSNKSEDFTVIRLHDEWSVNNDFTGEEIHINDFSENVYKQIIDWCKTATFYSVGSFS